MAALFREIFMCSKNKPVPEQMIVSTRSTRPAHFLFKIESFTKLSEIVEADYESPEFECGGHKWKLSLYPSGNKRLGGEGYISLYLVSAEAGMVTLGSDHICAMFKLFIFDQKQDTYLTFQDGEVRKFNSVKKQWGFTRMKSLLSFRNVKNGYLVDDCCVFGVEILVIPPVVKSACFSFREDHRHRPHPSFTWKIVKNSSWNETVRFSDPFTALDRQWKLFLKANEEGPSGGGTTYRTLFQKANEEGPGGDSVYLGLVHHGRASDDSSNIYVKYRLTHKIEGYIMFAGRRSGENPGLTGRWFGENDDMSMGRCIKLSYVKDESKGYSLTETVTFEATILGVSKVITT